MDTVCCHPSLVCTGKLDSDHFDRDNDIDGIMELTFAVDDEKFGEHRTIDLIPGGRDIPVTNENKAQYIECVTVSL